MVDVKIEGQVKYFVAALEVFVLSYCAINSSIADNHGPTHPTAR